MFRFLSAATDTTVPETGEVVEELSLLDKIFSFDWGLPEPLQNFVCKTLISGRAHELRQVGNDQAGLYVGISELCRPQRKHGRLIHSVCDQNLIVFSVLCPPFDVLFRSTVSGMTLVARQIAKAYVVIICPIRV